MPKIPSVPELMTQEQRLRIASFDFNAAWSIGCHIREQAIAHRWAIAIEVYAYGQTLFFAGLPGSCREHQEWIARKRNTVLRNARSSLLTGEQYQTQSLAMETLPYINAQRYTDSGGSFPLLTPEGAVFGAVTVSGLASEDDHALAAAAIEQYLKSK